MNEEDLSGKTIEGYHIVRPIGQGKFATVYKAETPEKKIVALKKIKIFEMNDAKLRDKCLKEVRLMQQLEDPNIIKYLDSFISNNELIIVTEWAEKGDLKRLLKNSIQSESPIDEPKVWDYMNQIAGALKHMHEKRIMHRDLKPANIFIASDDKLKVGDFGLGRIFSEESVQAYSKVGTPLYMSPELLIGQGYDMKSDVWSLGCIVYEMCEMKSPFRNENEKMSLMDLFNNITKGEYQPISKKFSEQLRTLVQKMIVVEPKNRCEISYVIEQCEKWKEKQKNVFKIDCLIVMEDISEKLNLLHYRANFCRVLKKKPICKNFFATHETGANKEDKFWYFSELCRWLSENIRATPKGKLKPVKEATEPEDSKEARATKVLQEAKKFGVNMNPPITADQLVQGFGDGICFILNEFLNRQLISMNYKFDPPSIDKFNSNKKQSSPEKSSTGGKGDISDLDDEKLFVSANFSPQMDFDDEKAGGLRNSSTTYYSNSNSTSATSIADQNLKPGKKFVGGIDLKEDMIIDENHLMEFDSVEWNKEINRVSDFLEDLNNKIQRQDPEVLLMNADDKDYHIRQIKENCHEILRKTKKITQHPIEKRIYEWDQSLQSIQKGERLINNACMHLTDSLREVVAKKKHVHSHLTQRTENMKAKILELEEINKKIAQTNDRINEKEQFMTGSAKKKHLTGAIERLRDDLNDLEVKQEVMRTLLFKNKVYSKEPDNSHITIINQQIQ